MEDWTHFLVVFITKRFCIGSELITHSVIIAWLMTFSTRQLLLVKDNANDILLYHGVRRVRLIDV